MSPSTILLIDDDQVDRGLVRRALVKSGLEHTLVEATDGRSGLDVARSQDFDCVLLDYRLPDVDTFDLLAALIAPEGGAQAVLMLTGDADPDVAVRLIGAGALDHLTKADVTPSSLARAIRYAKARRDFIAELRDARREAEEKSLALDMLNRQKSLFFSIIAHDLRNPFQAILGLSRTLSQAVEARDQASVERRARAVLGSASQVADLMEGLFAWASLQMDTVTTKLAELDVGEIAMHTRAGAEMSASDKGLMIVLDCGGTRVIGHQGMVAAVLRNLVSNAIKFTQPGGRITIFAAPQGSKTEIAVSDTGIGMPPDKVADLFKLDQRSTTNGTAGERGSGLGLLLCRDLVERMGGALTVSSVVGSGTRFSFRLEGASKGDVCPQPRPEASHAVAI